MNNEQPKRGDLYWMELELMRRYGIAEGTVKSRASRVRERVRVGLG